jgi:hypothetical protein
MSKRAADHPLDDSCIPVKRHCGSPPPTPDTFQAAVDGLNELLNRHYDEVGRWCRSTSDNPRRPIESVDTLCSHLEHARTDATYQAQMSAQGLKPIMDQDSVVPGHRSSSDTRTIAYWRGAPPRFNDSTFFLWRVCIDPFPCRRFSGVFASVYVFNIQIWGIIQRLPISHINCV